MRKEHERREEEKNFKFGGNRHEQPSALAGSGCSAGRSGRFGRRENPQTPKKGTTKMKEFLTTFTATLIVIAAVTWITPDWLKTVMEWILCLAVTLWVLPDVIFA